MGDGARPEDVPHLPGQLGPEVGQGEGAGVVRVEGGQVESHVLTESQPQN